MNIPRAILISIVSIVLVLSACKQRPQPLSFSTKPTQEFADLMQQHDAEKLSMMFTEDSKLMPPNAPVIQGRAAIRYFFQEGFAQEGLPTVLAERDRFVTGDYAYRDGIVTLHLKDGSTQIGKFMQLWKNVNGTWQLHRSIWNVS